MDSMSSVFGDQRLDMRYAQMQQAMLAQPHGCLSQVFAGWGALKAAYRFLK
jgi:hypothetical protein